MEIPYSLNEEKLELMNNEVVRNDLKENIIFNASCRERKEA